MIGLALLKHWKLIAGGLVFIGLLIALMLARADARHWERKALRAESLISDMRRDAAEQQAANEKRLAVATADYAYRLAAIEPIILTSRETVREYAQTPAGRAECLPADRVDGVRADRARLFPSDDPATPESGDGAVPAVSAP